MKGINASYCLLQGTAWSVNGCIYGFSSVFLLACGLSNTTIGIILAIATGLSFLFQLVFGELINNTGERGLKKFFVICSISLFFYNVSILFNISKWLSILLFLASMSILHALPAFLNSAAMFEIKKGIPIDYGAGRGIGSLGYSLFSFIVGKMILRLGNSAIFIFASFVNIAFAISIVIFFESIEKTRKNDCFYIKADKKAIGIKQFIAKYPHYIITLVGIIFIMIGYTNISNFMYQIVLYKGGNTANSGAATSISAFFEIPAFFTFNRIRKLTTNKKWIFISCFIMLLKLLFSYFAPNLIVFQIAQCLQIGYGLFLASSVYYTNDMVNLDESILGQSFLNSAPTIGVLLSLLTGGRIVDKYNASALLLFCIIIFIIGSIIMLIGMQKKNSSAN